ncbi:MAG: flagellar hook-basal body complex protein FliE [Acidobacteriota bacterium]
MLPIQPINLPAISRPEALTSTPSSNGGDAFRALLDQSVRSVSQLEGNATDSVNKFISGEGDDVHNVMLSVQRADLAFDMFMQVRNKVVSAYQEVMRMPE